MGRESGINLVGRERLMEGDPPDGEAAGGATLDRCCIAQSPCLTYWKKGDTDAPTSWYVFTARAVCEEINARIRIATLIGQYDRILQDLTAWDR